MAKEDIKILLIDDDEQVMKTVRWGLSELGYSHFQEALDCSEALRLVQSYGPHLIFIDTEMNPDGFETYRRIKADYKRDVAVIGMSLDTTLDAGYQKKWGDVGADGFLDKMHLTAPKQRERCERIINKALDRLARKEAGSGGN